MKITFAADSFARRGIIIATFFVLAVAHWYIGKWGFANMMSTRADAAELADLAVTLGPDDPQTHYAAAVVFDRTFLAQDQQRSLREYEQAVALAPHNYLLWLEFGKALGRSGDLDGAESTLRRAQLLAPNYSAVKWTLGNLLVRKTRVDEGFDLIRQALESDKEYAGPAATLAFEFFNGDLNAIGEAIGRSDNAKVALVLTLARSKRYDEAAAVWTSIPHSSEDVAGAGRSLLSELVAAKHFRRAFEIAIRLEPERGMSIGNVTDGGFEKDVKLDRPGPFEWQISAGSQPQPLQSTSQPHGGSRSLVLRYSSNDGAGLRGLSHIIVVEPGAKYKFRAFYRSDLKPPVPILWQLLNPSNNTVIAEFSFTTAADWTSVEGQFAVPTDAEGVLLRLGLKPCGSTICPVSGSVWLDDVTIEKMS